MVSVWLLLVVMLANLLMRDAVMAKTAISGVFIALASIIAASFGQYLFKRLPVTWLKTFAHGLLVVIGISMLVI